MRFVTTLCSLLLLSASGGPAFAANDETKYQGDKLSFPVNVRGTIDNAAKTPVCIPLSVSLRGLSDLAEDGLKVRLSNVFGKPIDCDSTQPIPGNVAIVLAKATVLGSAPSRYGLTYGGLVVPFKYHLNGDKEFRSGGTIAPYLGYRFDKNYLGVGVKLVGFLGGAGVPVEQTVDGVKKTQTLAGLSYGLGVIGTVKGDFQLGFIVGADRVSTSANYANNGKWWTAMAVGFSFGE